jgi:hypothetical protein
LPFLILAILRQLKETERKLREALSLPKDRFQRVAEAIKECCDDIDNYLKEDTWVHFYLLDYM